MSKKVLGAFAEVGYKQASKIGAVHNPGSRILPSRNTANDEKLGLRVDAGEVVNGQKTVYLQVNREAKATVLKDWIKENGTHANLAQATFDTNAQDREKEEARVLEDLLVKAKAKLG